MLSAELVALPEGRRGLPRQPMRMPGEMVAGDGWRAVCRVTDLTRFGARVHTATPMRRDTILWVTLPGQRPIRARVVWTDDLDAGCLFERPLTVSAFNGLVQRFKLEPRDPGPRGDITRP